MLHYYRICIFLFYLGFTLANSYADENPIVTSQSKKLWAVGTSITYPLGAQIYMVQVSHSVGQSGEILFGVAYQNWKNDQGRSHAYTLLLGYRHFLWRGLHTEIELWPAYNPFRSSIDGRTYKGFELWTSVRIGYSFDLMIGGQNFFVLAQPSLGFGVARQNKWPDFKELGNFIFEPQLIVGVRL